MKERSQRDSALTVGEEMSLFVGSPAWCCQANTSDNGKEGPHRNFAFALDNGELQNAKNPRP
jgi:hypothetical protein